MPGDAMSDELSFSIKPYEELSKDELYEILWLRDVVFVVGQKITAVSEIDGEDPRCSHAMLYLGDRLVGTARIFEERSPMVIGRVAIHTDYQGQGLGSELMREVQQHLGDRASLLHAQAHLERWYTHLGWRREGDEFMEAEIPHVSMVWPD